MDLERLAANVYNMAHPILHECTDEILYYCVTRGIDRGEVSSLYILLESLERLFGERSDLLLNVASRMCSPAPADVRERDLLSRVWGELILGLLSGDIPQDLDTILDFVESHTGDVR